MMKHWVLKSETIQKRTLRFFTKQINLRSAGSWCIKGTEESDIGLVCLVKKRKIDFRILSDLRIQRTVRLFTIESEKPVGRLIFKFSFLCRPRKKFLNVNLTFLNVGIIQRGWIAKE